MVSSDMDRSKSTVRSSVIILMGGCGLELELELLLLVLALVLDLVFCAACACGCCNECDFLAWA